jgi:excisionase family DNA binding protein
MALSGYMWRIESELSSAVTPQTISGPNPAEQEPCLAFEETTPKPMIQSLETHSRAFVTTNELSEYWVVSRKQIYKQIQAGTLKAIRFGPRLMRISTAEALTFERMAKMQQPQKRPAASPVHKAPVARRAVR